MRATKFFDRQEGAKGLAERLKKTVALVGMMGSGKTAVGTALARRLGVPFLDSDAAIVEAANMSIAEIFERDGEAFFRARESEVLARLLEGRVGILSTGGGAYLSAANRELIHRKGVALWLKADTELLWNRVKHKSTRPLLRTADPRATLEDLVARREPSYALAELTALAQPEYSIAEMVEVVVDVLKQREDVLASV
ncbi:shikimate kinase [Vannielia litorea]|uniref:Shikimate kinase n=1 Tax=Vannielia litorea TaxID=1217970 RepID=A0A1N6F5Q5_9RHOB|nr:shikimate kinase [Vannielia litorea]SIN90595.1 shikimate kinase [Vannielia litorea]